MANSSNKSAAVTAKKTPRPVKKSETPATEPATITAGSQSTDTTTALTVIPPAKKRLSEHAQKILKLCGAFLLLAGISVGVFFALRAAGVTDTEGLQNIMDRVGLWAPVIFLLLQISVTVVLCIVPGTSMVFILCGCFVFGWWKAAIICSIGVIISSLIMFIIGAKLGEKIVIKLVGEDDLRKAQNLLKNKSAFYLPVMFLFPFFPDDALCMAAGLTKMKFWHFLLITVICRPIGVIVSCVVYYFLGPDGSFLDFIGAKDFRTIDWILFANLVLIDIFFIFKFVRWVEKKVSAKMQAKKAAK